MHRATITAAQMAARVPEIMDTLVFLISKISGTYSDNLIRLDFIIVIIT
jgi:hypothetical protein